MKARLLRGVVAEYVGDREYRTDGINRHSIRQYRDVTGRYFVQVYVLDRTTDVDPPYFCLYSYTEAGRSFRDLYKVINHEINGSFDFGVGATWKEAENIMLDYLGIPADNKEEIEVDSLEYNIVKALQSEIGFVNSRVRRGMTLPRDYVRVNVAHQRDDEPLEAWLTLENAMTVSYTLSIRPVRVQDGEPSILPFALVPASATVNGPFLEPKNRITITWPVTEKKAAKRWIADLITQLWRIAVKDEVERLLRRHFTLVT